jgi:hypothetical protein
LIEAFFSQYHEPVLPYPFKIAFGMFELIGLLYYLSFTGSRREAVVRLERISR